MSEVSERLVELKKRLTVLREREDFGYREAEEVERITEELEELLK